MIKIYVATSWKNQRYKKIIEELRKHGFEIHDWQVNGFAWQQIDHAWSYWNPLRYVKALLHPCAVEGFNNDLQGMRESDVCIMVLPCGKSAHLEAGWFTGQGKLCYILLENTQTVEPELMYKLATMISISLHEIILDIKSREKML